MKKKINPLSLGKLTLANPVFYAPLAGCSDFPYRRMSARYNPGLMYCEMVKMDALIRYDQNTFHMLDFDKSMHPIGGQICGSKPQIAGKAAKIIEDLGFDVVDLNCGCPVDKVTKDGSGSGLLKNPRLIGDLIANMVAAVKIPVTVKIRAGWSDDNIIGALITEIAEQAGASAICIHGRTRQQAYRGPANWDYIKACKAVAKEIKIIGNGDVFCPKSALEMFEHTGCDAVLVARGTMGQPWIVQDILDYFDGIEPRKKSMECYRQELHRHFIETVNYHHEKKAIVDMRRIGCWYLKKSAGTRSFREQISRAACIRQIEDLILSFPLSDIMEDDGEDDLLEDCC